MPRPAIVTARRGIIHYPVVPHSTMRHVPAIRSAAIELASFADFTIRHACPSNYAGLVNRIRELDKACEALRPSTLKSR